MEDRNAVLTVNGDGCILLWEKSTKLKWDNVGGKWKGLAEQVIDIKYLNEKFDKYEVVHPIIIPNQPGLCMPVKVQLKNNRIRSKIDGRLNKIEELVTKIKQYNDEDQPDCVSGLAGEIQSQLDQVAFLNRQIKEK